MKKKLPKQLRFEYIRRGLTIWLKIIYPEPKTGGTKEKA